jgi:hypothetical protein
MIFVTTLFNYVRDDWDTKVVMECVRYLGIQLDKKTQLERTYSLNVMD